MEKQKQSNTLAHYVKTAVVQPSLGVFGILKEAFKTSLRNGRLLLFITLIMLSYYTVMGFAEKIILMPILEELYSDPKLLTPAPAQKTGTFANADPALQKAFLQVLRRFLTYEVVAVSILCVVLVFSITASVHSTFEAYTAKVLSLKEMVLGIRRRWKRALKTSIWMIIISLASAALLFFVVGLVGFLAGDSSMKALSWGVLIFGGCYSVFLCSLWMFGLVVSIVEENSSGLKAISEANGLMKGKKLKGFALMVVMILVGGALSMAFDFLNDATAAATENAKLAMVVGFVKSVSWNVVFCAIKVFVFVVFTIFYHECKQIKIAEENRALYSPLGAVAEF